MTRELIAAAEALESLASDWCGYDDMAEDARKRATELRAQAEPASAEPTFCQTFANRLANQPIDAWRFDASEAMVILGMLLRASNPASPAPASVEPVTCKTCGGSGQVQTETRHDIDEWEYHDIDCPKCDGSGEEPLTIASPDAERVARLEAALKAALEDADEYMNYETRVKALAALEGK